MPARHATRELRIRLRQIVPRSYAGVVGVLGTRSPARAIIGESPICHRRTLWRCSAEEWAGRRVRWVPLIHGCALTCCPNPRIVHNEDRSRSVKECTNQCSRTQSGNPGTLGTADRFRSVRTVHWLFQPDTFGETGSVMTSSITLQQQCHQHVQALALSGVSSCAVSTSIPAPKPAPAPVRPAA